LYGTKIKKINNNAKAKLNKNLNVGMWVLVVIFVVCVDYLVVAELTINILNWSCTIPYTLQCGTKVHVTN